MLEDAFLENSKDNIVFEQFWNSKYTEIRNI